MGDDSISSVTTDGTLGGWIVRISFGYYIGGFFFRFFFFFWLGGKTVIPVLGLPLFLYPISRNCWLLGVYFTQIFPFSAFLPEDRHILPAFAGGNEDLWGW